eukprot:3211765-Pleurochrysis_carterae.AAC.1
MEGAASAPQWHACSPKSASRQSECVCFRKSIREEGRRASSAPCRGRGAARTASPAIKLEI